MTSGTRLRAALALAARLCRVSVTTALPGPTPEPGARPRPGTVPDVSLIKVEIVLGRR